MQTEKIRPTADWHSTKTDHQLQFQLKPSTTGIDQPSASSQRLAGSFHTTIAQRCFVLRSANPPVFPSTAAETGPTNEKVRKSSVVILRKCFHTWGRRNTGVSTKRRAARTARRPRCGGNRKRPKHELIKKKKTDLLNVCGVFFLISSSFGRSHHVKL